MNDCYFEQIIQLSFCNILYSYQQTESYFRCCTFEDNKFLIGQNITTFVRDECSIGTLHCMRKDGETKVGLSVDTRCFTPEECPSPTGRPTPKECECSTASEEGPITTSTTTTGATPQLQLVQRPLPHL